MFLEGQLQRQNMFLILLKSLQTNDFSSLSSLGWIYKTHSYIVGITSIFSENYIHDAVIRPVCKGGYNDIPVPVI